MKKIILLLTIIVSIFIYKETKNNEVIIPDSAIRLRVIPNSNSALDQNMKLKVKDYLENNTYNLLKDTKDIDEDLDILNDEIDCKRDTVKCFSGSKTKVKSYFETFETI